MRRLERMLRSSSDFDDTAPAEERSLDELTTEAGGKASLGYDLLATGELVDLMNREDRLVPDAVAASRDALAAAVDGVVDRLGRGGRLVYVGAGSSGRIAAVDAAECESTFSTPPGLVVALVAGGIQASPLEQEAAEDDGDAGRAAIRQLGVRSVDAVVGVTASGRTPYVLGAIETAAEAGALTIGLVSVEESELARVVEHEIAVVVGPEFIAGSTRLKAGSAQKLVLNAISTISMIRLGKTFGNLMVDVNATNEKLRARVLRIVQTATGVTNGRAEDALAAASGNAKVAIVSLLAEVTADEARARLDAAGGSIRRAVESGNAG
jgi:N-acetylmuramic acid 6-phosphate etherase